MAKISAPPSKSKSTTFAALATPSTSVLARAKQLKSSKEHWKPRAFQRRVLKFILERRYAAFFGDPGVGKTSISYAALKVLKNEGLLRGALVVAPKNPAVSTWPAEQQRWAEFADLDVCVLHGKDKDKLVKEDHDVYVVNYEGLRWLETKGHLRDLFKRKRLCTLVLDELQKVKHTSSGVHKLLARWHQRFERRWGLTGSPASNGLLDLFGQVLMLDAGKAFGPYVTYFRANFFTPVNADSDYPTWVPKPGGEALIYERLKNLAIRIDADDYIDMPTVIPNVIRLELDEKSRDLYDEMENDMFVVLDGDRLHTAASAAAVSMKCRQIASGALYEDMVDPLTGMPRGGKRKFSCLHDLKLEALEDLIDELQGNQLLIAYEFDSDRQRIQTLLPDAPAITGLSTKKLNAVQDAWNAGEIRHMLVHPSGIHGLNIQRSNAHHLAMYTMTWNYEWYDQLVRRLRRQGNSAARLFVHHFKVKDTVEDAVYASLSSKKRTQDNLHAALRTYRQRRKSVTK